MIEGGIREPASGLEIPRQVDVSSVIAFGVIAMALILQYITHAYLELCANHQNVSVYSHGSQELMNFSQGF